MKSFLVYIAKLNLEKYKLVNQKVIDMNCHPYCRYEFQAEGTAVEFALLIPFLLTQVHVFYILHFYGNSGF